MKARCLLATFLMSSPLFAQTPPPKDQAAGESPPPPSAAPPAPASASASGSGAEPTPASNPKTDAANTKPKTPKAGQAAPVSPPVAQKPKPLPDCATYIATPMDTPLIEIEKKIFFTSPKLPDDEGAATAYLVEVNLEEGKAKRVAGFKSGRYLSLKAHGGLKDAISILDFSQGKSYCGEGKTTGIAIKVKEQKVTPSFALANYALVPGDQSTYLAELDQGLIQLLDITTGQKRTLERFNVGTRPLFLKASPPTVIYKYDPTTRELAKHIANKKVADSVLKLKDGMRLIRDESSFGILQEKSGSQIQVTSLKDWSGTETKSLELELPPGFQASSIGVIPRFEKGETIVFGKDDAARRAMRSIVVYNGEKPKRLKAPNSKSYFSAVSVLESGAIALLVSDIDTSVVKEFWLMEDGATRKIEVLKMKKAQKKSEG